MNIPDYAEPPANIGELRKRLEALGNPWTVAPHLGDSDPLPQPPRGGEFPREDAPAIPGLKTISNAKEFEAIVHAEPPANPLLARRWVELGVLSAERAAAPFAAAPGHAPVAEWGVA